MYENLRDEFEYYLNHQAEFVDKYNGKVIALKNHTVLGAYASEWDAVKSTLKDHAAGSFIVQRVTPGKEAYTVSVASYLVLADG